MHETENVVIKTADVDKNIVPLVNWINSFDDLETLFCCEGNQNDPNLVTRAYVMFCSQSQWSLMQVMKVFEDFNRTIDEKYIAEHLDGNGIFNIPTVDISFEPNYCSSLRYTMGFQNRDVMMDFIDYIGNKK